MASGRNTAYDLSAATYTTIYTVPASVTATCNINLCNRNATAATVRIALAAATGTPDNSEFIEYNAVIPPYGVLERSAIVLATTQKVTVYSDVANVSAVSWTVEG